jgi:hypothetical protein
VTYSQWREYGYVSRLSDIVALGPGPGQNINTANAISGQQLGVASQAGQQQNELFQQFLQNIAPLQTQQTALASGNRQAALSAAMPVISQISTGFNAAKQQIMNNLPPGAARDAALANLQTQSAGGVATAQANMVQNAPNVLASLGSSEGSLSLQDLGAQLAALSGGAQTNMGAGQMAAAQQASMLNFFGGLAKDVTGLVNPISLFGGGSSNPSGYGTGGGVSNFNLGGGGSGFSTFGPSSGSGSSSTDGYG